LNRVEDKTLAKRLMEMTRKLYLAMHGTGYARTDIRMNEAGELFILEINPNNGILYKPEDLGPADVMMEYDAEGHGGFLDRIFRSAIIRQGHRSLEN
jgi:D-alanine-D-alanine ligase